LRGTALRVWDVDEGRLTAEIRDVFAMQPTGICDAFFWPWGSAVATLGEANAHAWDLSTGLHLGTLAEVSHPDEVRRAKAAGRCDPAPLPDHPSLVRRIDFTHDGERALVLVGGDRGIRVVGWPKPRESVATGNLDDRT
jgi:hypothetical protein